MLQREMVRIKKRISEANYLIVYDYLTIYHFFIHHLFIKHYFINLMFKLNLNHFLIFNHNFNFTNIIYHVIIKI